MLINLFCVIVSISSFICSIATSSNLEYPPDKINEVINKYTRRANNPNSILNVKKHSSKESTPMDTLPKSASASVDSKNFTDERNVQCIGEADYAAICFEEPTEECIDVDADGYDDDCDCDAEDSDERNHRRDAFHPTNGNLKHNTYETPQTTTRVRADTIRYNTEIPNAIVFAYHEFNGAQLSRSSLGNQYKAALSSIRAVHPSIPIYIFTNNMNSSLFQESSIDIKDVNMIDVDWQASSQFQSLWEYGATIKNRSSELFQLISRLESLLYGWKASILPERVILLAPNVIVRNSGDKEFGIQSIIEPLQHYDIAGCFEGFAKVDAGGLGWGINVDVLGVKGSAIGLIEAWLTILKTNPAKFVVSMDAQQQALMLALENFSEYRAFPLPNTFNFKASTVFPGGRDDPSDKEFKFEPIIVNTDVYRDGRIKMNSFEEAAKVIVTSTIENELFAMKGLDNVPMPTLDNVSSKVNMKKRK